MVEKKIIKTPMTVNSEAISDTLFGKKTDFKTTEYFTFFLKCILETT